MKFLKTIRFDESDTYVFTKAAAPDSWAIPGSFMFDHIAPQDLAGKERQAFRNGFLAFEDIAWSTFVSVADIDTATFKSLNQILAAFLLDEFGAPDEVAANKAALAELEFVSEICADAAVNTVFTLQREFDEDGTVKEAFRIVDAPSGIDHNRVWELVEE